MSIQKDDTFQQPTKPLVSTSCSLTEDDPYGTKKWRRDFAERVVRFLEDSREQFREIKKLQRQALAKMHAMNEMREIHELAAPRFQQEWENYRELSREQKKEALTRIYNEELTAKMQYDLLNKMEGDWDEHRMRRIELIQWSKLSDSDKEKWLAFYSKPMQYTNMIEGANYASETPEHSKENQQ